MYICQSQSPNSSHHQPTTPLCPLGVHTFVLYIWGETSPFNLQTARAAFTLKVHSFLPHVPHVEHPPGSGFCPNPGHSFPMPPLSPWLFPVLEAEVPPAPFLLFCSSHRTHSHLLSHPPRWLPRRADESLISHSQPGLPGAPGVDV